MRMTHLGRCGGRGLFSLSLRGGTVNRRSGPAARAGPPSEGVVYFGTWEEEGSRTHRVDRGSWIVDSGSWIVDRGSWIVKKTGGQRFLLAPRSTIHDPRISQRV